MLRKRVAVCLTALLFCGNGCVAVWASSTRLGTDRAVATVDGHVYIIDKCSGRAREVDLAVADPLSLDGDNDE